jgi:hypothetical protein
MLKVTTSFLLQADDWLPFIEVSGYLASITCLIVFAALVFLSP